MYEMPGGQYMAVTLVVGILSLISITLVMRFILRPNVEPLKNITVEQLNKNPLPPMNTVQKIVFAGILVFILAMLLPTFFPSNPVMAILKKNITGIAMTIVAILAAITVKGKPVLNFSEVISKNFSWQTYLMIGTSMQLGSILTHESVGFTALLQHILTPVFTGMDLTVFIVALLAVAIVATNLMNSVVLVMILQPIIWTFSTITSVNSLPISMLVIFASLATAAITPSASPYAATIFGQKEYVEPTDIYKYASTFVLAESIIIFLVGIPLANLVIR